MAEMMNRREFVAGVTGLWLSGGSWAEAEAQLVTPEMVQDEQGYETREGLSPSIRVATGRRRSLEFPVITVVAPPLDGGDLVAPFRVELAFSTTSDAKVMPSSLRVRYGFLLLDITDRVLQGATALTADRLLIERARIPSGSHRLVVTLADDKGHSSQREMRIRVV